METAEKSESDQAIFYDALCHGFDRSETDDVDDKIKIPNLEIAQVKFHLTLPEFADDDEKITQLMASIKADNMAPYYELICDELRITIDKSLLKNMQEANTKKIEYLDSEIEYALKNLGTVDVKEAYLNKAHYLSKIGNKSEAITTLGQAYNNTIALGCKLNNIFHCIRLGLFFHDLELIKQNLTRCEEVIQEGADWHYTNCFKIYKGLYSLAIRDFNTSTQVFTSVISTFACTELISLNTFIKYTVLSAMLVLKRADIKTQLITNPDVLQALNQDHALKEFVFTLYQGDFREFFKSLARMETEMRRDMLLHAHYGYYVNEMKIKAYDQLLSTYISLNLSYMAEQFGVTEDYLENDVYKIISSKRLSYKIDKISGKIVNVQPNRQSHMLDNIFKQGDLLLNRIQKLSRVINI